MIQDKFLHILLNVIIEHFSIIKTQQFRLNSLLGKNWPNFDITQFKLSYMKVDKLKFLTQLSYRIEVVRLLHSAMNDTLKVIKSLIDYLYGSYLTPPNLIVDFEEDDIFSVIFLTNEILIGSLQQYFMLNLTTVPLGYILVAKYKDMMKIRPLSINQISTSMEHSNFYISHEEICSILDILLHRNYIEKLSPPNSSDDKFRFISNFDLSPKSLPKFQKKIRSLLEWIIGMWRSLYNVRSLDMPIPEEYPHREFLMETVKRAATQGYINATNVIENIGNYYQLLLEKSKEN